MDESLPPPVRQVLVARSVVILAEYNDNNDVDYSWLTAPILGQLAAFSAPPSIASLPNESHPRLILQKHYQVNVLPHEGFIFLAVSSRNSLLSPGAIQSILREIAIKFVKVYGKGGEMPLITIPYSMNAFASTIAQTLRSGVEKALLSSPVGHERESRSLGDVVVVHMSINVLDGQTNGHLVDRSEGAEQGKGLDEGPALSGHFTRDYQRERTILRRSRWWKNSQLLTVVLVSMALFVYVYVGYLL